MRAIRHDFHGRCRRAVGGEVAERALFSRVAVPVNSDDLTWYPGALVTPLPGLSHSGEDLEKLRGAAAHNGDVLQT